MADQQDVHASESLPASHGAIDDHGSGDGHEDHGHADGEALGPLDLPAWGASILGVVLGLVTVLAFLQAAA